jgi:hypothetical protein
MDVGHIDHPGTTVQTAAGLLIRVVYLFSGTDSDLSTDVLSDPEKYLRPISYLWVFISCCVLFLCGRKIYKTSGNILTAFYFQSVVLVISTIFTQITDLRPEGFLVWGGMILVTICFSFIHEREISSRRMLLYALKFGIIIAFLVITKVTALPLLVIPLFLLRKWKSVAVYFGVVLVSALLFLIPALSRIKYFFTWAYNLLFHSGIYGQGKEEIIDPAAFRQGLGYIFSYDTFFLLVVVLMAITLAYLIVKRKATFKLFRSDARLRLFVAVFSTVVVCTLMVAKHFKTHYLIPAYILLPLGSYLSLSLIGAASQKALFFFQRKSVQRIAFILVVGSYSLYNLSQVSSFGNYRNHKIETADFLAKYKNVPRLYITYEFYSTEVPPSLYFGLCYSGTGKEEYIPILNKVFPSVYFYSFPENQFHDWENMLQFTDILSRNQRMIVCFYYTDPTVVQGTIDLLNEVNKFNKVMELTKLYDNPQTGEQVYEMIRTGKIVLIPDSAKTIFCDAEKSADDKLISTEGGYKFQGAEAKVKTAAHSGDYALELNKVNQFGFVFHLPVDKKKHYEISVWRKSADKKGVLIATAANSSDFYLASPAISESGENGWNKLRLSFSIPENFQGDEISVGVWNEGGDNTVYFDDFEIVEY